MSTGAPHLLVQARTRAMVDRAAPEPRRLAAVLSAVGIAEDPATGTAAGPLATHLVTHGRVADGSAVLIEQGFAIGRPSRIEIRVDGSRVTISGSAVIAAEGTLRI